MKWMLDSVFSPIDWTLRRLGLLEGNLFWLGRPNLAMISVIAVHVWRITPLAAVIVMAGMMAIRATSRRRASSTAPGSGAGRSRCRFR